MFDYTGMTAEEILAAALEEKKAREAENPWRCDDETPHQFIERMNNNFLDDFAEIPGDDDFWDSLDEEGSGFSMLIPAWKNIKCSLNGILEVLIKHQKN
jgi:hypothetical protein